MLTEGTLREERLVDTALDLFDVPPTPSEKPFQIQLRQEEKQSNGSFRPAAALCVSEAFRTSGLLFALAPEDLKSLLFLLTFLSPNGECQASLHQLAPAMRISAFKAQRRMQRLMAFPWNEEPLILELKKESGMISYAPHPQLIGYQDWSPPEPVPPPLPGGSRAEVIAHSRARYGRPREKVEREMAQRMGWDRAEKEMEENAVRLQRERDALTPHVRTVLQRLEEVGLTTEQALDLLHAYDLLRIERQLQWLPYRHAKNPAGFLLAAIADNYEAPPALRPGSRSLGTHSLASPISSESMSNQQASTASPVEADQFGVNRVLEIPTSSLPSVQSFPAGNQSQP